MKMTHPTRRFVRFLLNCCIFPISQKYRSTVIPSSGFLPPPHHKQRNHTHTHTPAEQAPKTGAQNRRSLLLLLLPPLPFSSSSSSSPASSRVHQNLVEKGQTPRSTLCAGVPIVLAFLVTCIGLDRHVTLQYVTAHCVAPFHPSIHPSIHPLTDKYNSLQ